MLFRAAARAQYARSRAPPRGAWSSIPGASMGARVGINHGWPQAMKDELAGCKTLVDYNVWAAKWGAVLGGQTGGAKPDTPTRPPPSRRRTGEASGPI